MNKNKELFDSCIDCLTKELPVLRKMAGLTQKDMGEILGVSRQTITNIESGASKMKWPIFYTPQHIHLAVLFQQLHRNQ